MERKKEKKDGTTLPAAATFNLDTTRGPSSSSSFSSSSFLASAYISPPVWKARNFFFSEKTCA